MDVLISTQGVQVVFTRGPQGENGLKGERGDTGRAPRFYNGTGVPTSSTGLDNDMYINIANGDLYGPKTDNVWGVPFINLKGMIGASGANGANGAAGATGATPTLIAGTITALPYGSSPTANVVFVAGTTYRIDLGIPGGATGAAGPAGVVTSMTGNIVDLTNPAIPAVNQVQPDFNSVAGLSQILGLPAPRTTGQFLMMTATNGVITAGQNTLAGLGITIYPSQVLAVAGGVPSQGLWAKIDGGGDFQLMIVLP